MSDAATIERAAAGELPPWARAAPARRRHCARVARLLGRWADRLGLEAGDRLRWRAAGWLHDALRDADPARLRDDVAPPFRELPDPLLHGPAAAARLRADGIADEPVLRAIAHHTTGHPSLDALGRALYAADFLEPGRLFAPAWRAALRARMPDARAAVLTVIVRARITHLLERGRAVHPDTVLFWNSLLERR